MSEVWNPRMLVVNSIGANVRLPEEVFVSADGTVEYTQRLIGMFSSPFDLRRFPRDEQLLTIELASYRYGPEEVELVVDERLIAIGSHTAPGWRLEEGSVESHTLTTQGGAQQLVRATARVHATRISRYYLFTMVIPLVLIVAMAWTVFWIDPSLLPSQIAVSTASVFTLIAFRLSLRLFLPPTPYLTLADRFVLGCTLLVFSGLGQAIVTGRLARSGREDLARRVDVWGRWIYLGGLVVLWVVTAPA